MDCKIWQNLERRKAGSTLGKKRGVCLNLPFLKKKTKQNPTFFHKAFFFQKYLPLSIFSYLPMLIFQNKHLFLSTIECEEVPLRLCPTSHPGSNCHLLPMAQQMTKPTAGCTEQRWFHDGAVQMLPMGQFLKGKKNRTVFLCANKIVGPFDPMENVCLLVPG